MPRRLNLSMLTLAVGAVLAGCGGQAYHKQVREEAKDRVALMNAQLNFDQARQAYETGRFDQAQREIRIAIERAPEQPQYYVLQGRIALETHRLEAAIESFKTAMTKNPKLAAAHYYAGIVYQRWSNDQAAYEQYREASDLEDSNVNYLLAAAESLLAMKQLDSAEQLLESKLTYFENNAAMRQLLGQIAQLRGDSDTAAQLLAEARLLNPDDLSLLEELARVQYQAGLYSKSLQSVRLLEDRASETRSDLMLLEARCLTALDRPQDARRVYLELSKVPAMASDVELWVELGTVAWQLGDVRRVSICGQQLVAIAPDRFEGYVLKAVDAGQRGDAGAEVALLREAAARAERDAMPHLMLGQRLAQNGDAAGAAAAYAAALRADPTDPAAQTLLAQTGVAAETGDGLR